MQTFTLKNLSGGMWESPDLLTDSHFYYGENVDHRSNPRSIQVAKKFDTLLSLAQPSKRAVWVIKNGSSIRVFFDDASVYDENGNAVTNYFTPNTLTTITGCYGVFPNRFHNDTQGSYDVFLLTGYISGDPTHWAKFWKSDSVWMGTTYGVAQGDSLTAANVIGAQKHFFNVVWSWLIVGLNIGTIGVVWFSPTAYNTWAVWEMRAKRYLATRIVGITTRSLYVYVYCEDRVYIFNYADFANNSGFAPIMVNMYPGYRAKWVYQGDGFDYLVTNNGTYIYSWVQGQYFSSRIESPTQTIAGDIGWLAGIAGESGIYTIGTRSNLQAPSILKEYTSGNAVSVMNGDLIVESTLSEHIVKKRSTSKNTSGYFETHKIDFGSHSAKKSIERVYLGYENSWGSIDIYYQSDEVTSWTKIGDTTSPNIYSLNIPIKICRWIAFKIVINGDASFYDLTFDYELTQK